MTDLGARHDSTQTVVETDEQVWNWATSIMGEGISRRALGRADPPLHIMAEYRRIWCTGGPGEPLNTLTRRYCRQCLTLAREMREELGDD